MDDRELLDRCRKGEGGAWERLWALHAPAMRRAASQLLGNDAEAEEVCQKVFAKLADPATRALAGFQGRCRLGTWLVAVVLREASRHAGAEMARRARLASSFSQAPARQETPSPLEQLCGTEEARGLGRAMAALPSRDRLLLALRYRDGVPHAEAARVLGIALGSVTMLERRALERLRRALGNA